MMQCADLFVAQSLRMATDFFGTLGDDRDGLSTLLDVAEIVSDHPLVDAAVAESVSKGLPDDIKGEEDPLKPAKAAGDKERTPSALFGLTDLYWSHGNKGRARELCERTEKIRIVPAYLRTSRSIMATQFK